MRGIEKTKSGKFSVRSSVNGKKVYLGTFSCVEEAKYAYKKHLANVNYVLLGDDNSPSKNLSGEVFNHLTVIGYKDTINKKHYWECLCKCGSITYVKTSCLNNGNTKSCGCFKVTKAKERLSKEKGVASFNKTIGYYKYNAKRRGIVFNLTKEEFKEIVLKNCHYCNASPSNYFKKDTNGKFICNGVDRKDNKVGYELHNCLPCCTICNRAKSSMDYGSFIKYINRIKKL